MSAHGKQYWPTRILFGFLILMASTALAQAEETKAQASLYDRLGGLTAISVVVDDFIDRMVPDPFLNRNPAIAEARERVPSPYLKYHVTAFVCQATGGPCQYTGRGMEESHGHLNISDSEWDRMVVIFKEVMDEHQVPAREQSDLLQLIGSTRDDIVTAGTNE